MLQERAPRRKAHPARFRRTDQRRVSDLRHGRPDRFSLEQRVRLTPPAHPGDDKLHELALERGNVISFHAPSIAPMGSRDRTMRLPGGPHACEQLPERGPEGQLLAMLPRS